MAIQSCAAGQAKILSRNALETTPPPPVRRDSMTDNLFPAISASALPNAAAYAHNQRVALPRFESTSTQQLEPEDDGQISCFCGYLTDDGNTVACDACNRWQHIICYYPQYNETLPEDLAHFCVDCRPRSNYDKAAARERQRARREKQESASNGPKRQPAKSHKKRVPPVLANGWSHDKARHDRNSASPRDQPPPAKRPKTSHHTSDSASNVSTKTVNRKRNGTNAAQSRSLSNTPENFPLYSSEFQRAYSNDTWTVTGTNLHNDIAVTNSLSEWLRAPEEGFKQEHGCEKAEVLMRWDRELDDIPGRADTEIQDYHDDQHRFDDGGSAIWKVVTVKDPIAMGAYIGEVRGHVGFKSHYKEDVANRWPLLRHPEPFVFFHPRLPIYIDARDEGTELRYVRRSCQPNARLQILVTNSTDYRFCFMATEQIEPGQEIAVSWDTTDSLPPDPQRNHNALSTHEMDLFTTWVSTVLSNCGPCACADSPEGCKMSRFDRRGSQAATTKQEEEAQPVKLTKTRTKKLRHGSPATTAHTLNSRSGSEARRHDPDDEPPTDSRSTSGSRGVDTGSRDITPYPSNGASAPVILMPAESARERRKNDKVEELFKRQEAEQSGKLHKKKRTSGSSSLNTPTATTTAKHAVFPVTTNGTRYADASTAASSRQAPSAQQQHKGSTAKAPAKAPLPPPSAAATRHVVLDVAKSSSRTPQRPAYANAMVQCDLDAEEEEEEGAAARRPRKRFVSHQRRLLERCAVNNARAKRGGPRTTTTTTTTTRRDVGEVAGRDGPLLEDDKYEPPEPGEGDVVMRDAAPAPRDERKSELAAAAALSRDRDHDLDDAAHARSADYQPQPSAPPWPVLHPNMLLDSMPPPPSTSFNLSLASSTGLTPSADPFAIPAVITSNSNSTPRKKWSLSEYSKRKKEGGGSEAKMERESSPASASASAVGGPGGMLQLPSSSTLEAAVGKGAESAVLEEEEGMEDVVVPPTAVLGAQQPAAPVAAPAMADMAAGGRA